MNTKENKRGDVSNYLVALILTLIVVLFAITFVPKIRILLKTGTSYADELDTNDPNDQESKGAEKLIKGEIKWEPQFIIKMEDPIAIQKPTSPDYCLVGAYIRNTGETSWTYSDKVKVGLFCKYEKNQLKKDLPFVQTYPAQGYITNLEPGQEREVLFTKTFPNNCLESDETYSMVLYSNCDGEGSIYQPCDNTESDNPVKIIDDVQFNCQIS